MLSSYQSVEPPTAASKYFWGSLNTLKYLNTRCLVKYLVIISRKEERRSEGAPSFQPGASSPETKGKTLGGATQISLQNLLMTGWDGRIGQISTAQKNWGDRRVCSPKLRSITGELNPKKDFLGIIMV